MPATDNWPGTTISGQSGNSSGTNVGARPQSGEPANNGYTVWWAWTAPGTGQFYFSTEGNDGTNYTSFPCVLQAFTGSAVNGLTEVTYVQDQRYGIGNGFEWPSRIAFNAVHGTTYYIRVDSRVQANVNGGALLQGSIFLKWNVYNPVFLGPCGKCPAQFVSAVEQNCLANASVVNTAANAALPLAYLNADVPGIYQYNACGSTSAGSSAWFAWGNTFSPIANAIGNGFLSYGGTGVNCDDEGYGSGYNGTAVGPFAAPSNYVNFQANQIVIDESLYVSKQTIQPCAPPFSGWTETLFYVNGNPSTTPPSPLPPCWNGQTDYAIGTSVAVCGCSSGSYLYQANIAIQGSDLPGGGYLNNAYWVGGETAGPAQCTGFNLAGGTFNSGQCGIVYYAGLNPANYQPAYSGNISYIPMLPNLVLTLAPPEDNGGGPSPFYTTGVITLKNLSSEFTWPNLTVELLAGPNNLQPSGHSTPLIAPGQTCTAFNLAPGASNSVGLGFLPANNGASPFYEAIMPYVVELNIFMNGIFAGTESYTIQPVIQCMITPVKLSGHVGFDAAIKNLGLGASNNLKFSASCNNSPVLFSVNNPGLGINLNNQPSLTNIRLGSLSADSNFSPFTLFSTNSLNGTTAVQFTVTVSDDTYTYPPIVLSLVL